MVLNRAISKREPRRSWSVRDVFLIAAVVLGLCAAGRSFTRISHVSHCPAKLEASGVHFDERSSRGLPQENSERQRVYHSIEQNFRTNGLSLGAPITQGLSMSDIFQVKKGQVVPQLLALQVPVRAIVAPVTDPVASHRLSDVFMKYIASLVPSSGVWPQNSNLYHATVWHASTHQAPVPVNRVELDAEMQAVTRAMQDLCPLHLTLESVVITEGGVVMACWQVSRGTATTTLRASIQAVLPGAPSPDKQAVQNKAIWYTTLGRLLEEPRVGWLSRLWGSTTTSVLDAAARHMTEELCGLQMLLDRVWYVQEYERLALALNGRWDMEEVLLSEQECS
eukprot:jgi/Ulvmu1/7638/UM038_0065.1